MTLAGDTATTPRAPSRHGYAVICRQRVSTAGSLEEVSRRLARASIDGIPCRVRARTEGEELRDLDADELRYLGELGLGLGWAGCI